MATLGTAAVPGAGGRQGKQGPALQEATALPYPHPGFMPSRLRGRPFCGSNLPTWGNLSRWPQEMGPEVLVGFLEQPEFLKQIRVSGPRLHARVAGSPAALELRTPLCGSTEP